jgi:Vanadium chloroperoxidase N-terminal domain/PAP2 superfamily
MFVILFKQSNIFTKMTQDIILYWNEVVLEANKMSHTTGDDGKAVNGPTLSSRATAIVHLAMYDAYVGTSGSALLRYIPIATLPNAINASVTAAVSAAAHATLSNLYPAQKAFFESKHKQAQILGTTIEINSGHKFGQDVANEVLKLRKGDPNASDEGYSSYPSHGTHRPDPINIAQGYHAPFYGSRSKLFSSQNRYSLDTPPVALESDDDYKKALKQVRGKGIAAELMGTLPTTYDKRTVDETLVGIFWGYDGAKGLGTPPRLYNQIIREIAISQENTLEENAHLFALVNVAMGDAGILAWEQKYRYNYWRPVLGVREHDSSMGPLGTGKNNIDNDCDPLWLPLGAPSTNEKGKPNGTPHFPAYPSGHATFGGAVFQITKEFYKLKDKNLQPMFDTHSFISDEFNGVNFDNNGVVRPKHYRKFPKGLDQMIIENGLSRVWLGVHWSFDAFVLKDDGSVDIDENIGGVPLGVNIANDIFNGGLGIRQSSM